MRKVRGEAVLTAIDETTVVLVVSFASIAFPLEYNSSGALRTSTGVKVKSNLFQRANGGAEEILERDC